MLMTMEPDIQRNLENLSAYDMLEELNTLFAQQAEQELLQTDRFSLLQTGRKHGEDCLLSCHAIYGLKLHEQSPDQKKDYATSCNAGQAKSRKKNN
ncbi:hypothetical protein Tco_1190360 [Tanacetum coccineum]